jgi:hypothetical protein
MKMTQKDFHWVAFYSCGRALGVRSPYLQLQKAIDAGMVRQIGHGLYRVKRNRIEKSGWGKRNAVR